MSFLSTFDISASALTAQRFRMDIITQNLTNIDTTRTPDGGPYQRRQVVFEERSFNFKSSLDRAAGKYMSGRNSASSQVGGGVRVQEVVRDQTDFIPVYKPNHPDADEDGYVLMPNVDRAEETVDLMAAKQSYDSNITALNIIKAMAMKSSEILK